MPKTFRVLTTGVTFCLLLACGDAPLPDVTFQQTGEQGAVQQQQQLAVAKQALNVEVTAQLEEMGVTLKPIPKLPKVNPQGLMLKNFTAGFRKLLYGTMVILNFNLDPQADFIQIKRCDGALQVDGLQDKPIGSVGENDVNELETKFNEVKGGGAIPAQPKFDINDYWRSASITGCVLIGTKVIENEYYDVTARSDHEYFYIARACVKKNRIDERVANLDTPCSFNTKVSNKLAFIDPLADKEKLVRLEYQEARARMNEMVLTIHDLTVRLNTERDRCETAELEKLWKKNKKEAIAMLSGMAIGMVAGFMCGSYDPNTNASYGAKLGSAFADMFASADDYPKQCYLAEKLDSKIRYYQEEFYQAKDELADKKEFLFRIGRKKDINRDQAEDIASESKNK